MKVAVKINKEDNKSDRPPQALLQISVFFHS